MKKPAGVFIALYLLYTISGITCNDHYDSCVSINEKCSNDHECCYRRCSYSLFSFSRYCNDNTNLYDSITSFFRTKEEQTGMCSYNYNPENKAVDDGLYFLYGLNAGHAVLPPGTKVEVKLNDKNLIVTINNQPSKKNDVILELSRETAKTLNIPNGGKVPCTIVVVPPIENNAYYKYLKYILPYITLFTFLFRLLL
ncbi:uncharacterized protein LOC100165005 precursor [Acyrthosiphon pisum]|uniref:ACYPI005979 protein n=1 Tax=Acyrthosiphon pisum TaxID=7029 RepID=C4WUZ4_ACYPI|nr:uncharacterized protein LOC100165005 precursor [Acyrthosiphon pisum]BAH71714.1 ACYPI005979 [Acyrthosiphon pisum]|eukprot:NP_001155648.1 uncharacterized protein LOC100165005 precursor [Acyrthosiphon pisum]